MRSRIQALSGWFLAALICAPAWSAIPPQPGTINYIEGRATMGGQALGEKSVGATRLAQGQSFSTQDGRAEILLAPGISLRIDHETTVEMANPGLADTLVAVPKGRAMVEVAEIRPENNVRINAQSASTRLLKPALYDFDADRGQIRVFDGKAVVRVGERRVELKSGHELSLGARGLLKPQRFNKRAGEDDFYRWSSLRSSYWRRPTWTRREGTSPAGDRVAVGTVQVGIGTPGLPFIPGDGIFCGPFGWGFYSPWLVYEAPYFAYGYPFGYGPYHRHFGGYRPLYTPRDRPPGSAARSFSGGGRVGSLSRGAFGGPGGLFGSRSGGFGGSGGFGRGASVAQRGFDGGRHR